MRKRKHLAGTEYPVVNRRVRRLEESNYLEKAGTRRIKTKLGSQATLYQLTRRAHFAILLNKINIDNIQTAGGDTIIVKLAALMSHTMTLL